MNGIRPVSGGLSMLLFCSKKINNTKRANKHCCRGPQGPRHQRGKCRPPKICPTDICHQNASSKTCPAQRQVFFCFVFFVATKKMTLLSGNLDGFAVVQNKKEQQINDLLLSKYHLICNNQDCLELCQQPEGPRRRGPLLNC